MTDRNAIRAEALERQWLVPESVLMRLGRLSHRMKFRVDAIVEREGSVEKAITSHGVGIGYLLAKEIADACWAASEVMEQGGASEALPEARSAEHSSSSSFHSSAFKHASDSAMKKRQFVTEAISSGRIASASPSSSSPQMERMRVAMRDHWRRGCSKSCQREGGWMDTCPCLEIAELMSAALSPEEGAEPSEKDALAKAAAYYSGPYQTRKRKPTS